ncbi:putative Zn-binding protein involved in type VI secretion [Pseudoduganella lurida]|uniref:Putative Zn-binding protein involved in type VI secretion n=1 Tax=Pseudoduganella lurida TaxID=1036180 RepID=A0A562QWF8_9BURK|nr:PAAR domain-containing protein [Pseudoduganella lurida]TWI60943.1 putative Zn-binding protein involved in type VI secretion [Pseudoduganella lurida]
MKHKGKGVIRLNDKTSHGGTVLSAASGTVVLGQPAALAGDMTFCPQCKGTYPIQADGSGNKHRGKEYVYDGASTACGAKLISSIK